MDLPYSVLGRKRRKIFHSPLVNPWLPAILLHDPKAAGASTIRILEDNMPKWMARLLSPTCEAYDLSVAVADDAIVRRLTRPVRDPLIR